ncbi:MAG: L-ectoine synthase [Actinobacteria bacterium]|jgi:L-ectoine synthase|uniref:L-ectoine synthase n=1 Tax=freshwater metagenome TaxID=449393 RepID=A0A6J6XNS4_9ZZZZ|nr:L-ectoine synthase [Actinomycetota bacterium]
MIVVTSEEIADSPRHVFGPGWDSKRMIVKQHGVGFSMHETRVSEGAELTMQYLNHVEVNYCIAGEGEVTDVVTGITYPLRPGTIYALNKHDLHIVRAIAGDLWLVCVFSPALAGAETHTDEGSFDLDADGQ